MATLRPSGGDAGASEAQGIAIFQKLVSVARSPDHKMAELSRWVLAHESTAAGMTITEFARKTDVSETTVFRFCKILGLGGYKDLRFALAEGRGVAMGAQLAGGQLDALAKDHDGFGTILRGVIESNTEQLLKTANIISLEALSQATKLVLEAGQVHLVGFGSSAPVAHDAYRRFISLGIPASLHHDPHMLAAVTANARAGAVFFGVSCSGRTRDMIESFETAGRLGLPRIVLTSDPDAPVCAVSDVTLVSAVRRSPLALDIVGTRISQLAIIEAISVALMESGSGETHPGSNADGLADEIAKKRLPEAMHNTKDEMKGEVS